MTSLLQKKKPWLQTLKSDFTYSRCCSAEIDDEIGQEQEVLMNIADMAIVTLMPKALYLEP